MIEPEVQMLIVNHPADGAAVLAPDRSAYRDWNNADAVCQSARLTFRLLLATSQLAPEEVQAVLPKVEGGRRGFRADGALAVRYGLRVLECCRLRVKDVDLGRRQIMVRASKGARR